MRNGNCLPKLRPSNVIICLLIEHAVQVKVEAHKVSADQQEQAMLRRSEINVRRGTGVDMFEIAERDCRTLILARQDNSLKPCQHVAWIGLFLIGQTAIYPRLALHQKLQAGMNGELSHLIDGKAAGELRGVCGIKGPILKLQLTDRRERCRGGDCGPCRISFRNLIGAILRAALSTGLRDGATRYNQQKQRSHTSFGLQKVFWDSAKK